MLPDKEPNGLRRSSIKLWASHLKSGPKWLGMALTPASLFLPQLQCHLCGEDLAGTKGTPSSSSHQPSQRAEGEDLCWFLSDVPNLALPRYGHAK